MLHDLNAVIKQAALAAVNNSKPMQLYIATIVSMDPITVRMSQQITIDEAFLIKTQTLMSCSAGDKVVLLRQAGGSRYVVVDKVVE